MRFLLYILLLCRASCVMSQTELSLDSLRKLVTKYKETDLPLAIDYATRALKEAQLRELNSESVELLYELGQLHIKKGDYTSGINYFGRSLEIGRRLKNEKIISRSAINLANIYVTQGKYNSAVAHYLEALKINEKGSDTTLLHINYLCLGITYYYLKDYTKSLNYYEKCLAINRVKNESAKMAYSYNAMGIIYKEMNDLPRALEYQLKTNEIAEITKDSSLLSHNLGNLGELFGLKGDYEKAVSNLRKGLEMQKHFRDDKGMGESLVLLGNVNVKFNKNSEAIDYYRQAIEVANRVGINEIKKDAYKGLAEAYKNSGDYKSALDNQQMFSSIKDSLFNTTRSLQISDMQTRYETEKKEKENSLLLSENTVKTLEIDKQKTQRNLLFLLIGVILIIALLIYNRVQLKNRNKILQEKELRTAAVFQAQEKEKMNLSRELHDGLGPLLSLLKMNISALSSTQADQKLISEMKELTVESIKEVRNISHALAPSLLQKQGLKAALSDFISQVNSNGTLKADLQINFDVHLKAETEINIYRIIQEAVNNAMKHSEASSLLVNVTEKNGELIILVKDNGKGFDSSQKEISSGNGLNNILSRVDFMKGKTSINSSPGKGMEILISLPLSHA